MQFLKRDQAVAAAGSKEGAILYSLINGAQLNNTVCDQYKSLCLYLYIFQFLINGDQLNNRVYEQYLFLFVLHCIAFRCKRVKLNMKTKSTLAE